MTQEKLEKASEINKQIAFLKTDINDLRRCNHTLGIAHWSNCDVSYYSRTIVSQDIIEAIIAEKERKINELVKQFEEL